MRTRTPVEVTTRYATTVDDLPAAWAFVMGHIDQVGPDPTVHIAPVWTIELTEDETPRHFEVTVEGMTPEPVEDTTAEEGR